MKIENTFDVFSFFFFFFFFFWGLVVDSSFVEFGGFGGLSSSPFSPPFLPSKKILTFSLLPPFLPGNRLSIVVPVINRDEPNFFKFLSSSSFPPIC